ncbi:cadherin EGF LAG seven-pass G-type receptor 1-like [Pecten maximus]|uniref:cadherin EGF LAG seven-pass G-type receptor 1-like n=1 Tax=Pecten maximus TaxID=6579 RepID=UPI001458E859|nr:cadherin EGF LAG seven-pass G-type receptor 1-like [Pecten maximus]XP_033739260.1 cadherin EGF LAG seven-pass G-type receptor 1-like [Pecten maximus]XP_033739268.1 cadherin EGF LAG seven-pass G-type receptor 1-like [Pecten maximus]XP_033739275.1 cadherin EGF LAG seven-pass G-type receptor 1-like [Pecten maximus]XP_033739282.1 cadherin EGF LAG seven-pass G-type receptor 1-like [Pecten maximus]XP_033739286.1 cadherin EGF LAG seven-pass G-type receptor 1-like [Pecten maximus]XP_033739287.1 ca
MTYGRRFGYFERVAGAFCGVGLGITILCGLGLSCVGRHGVSAATDFASACHTSYYNTPECIDHPDGYGCECGSGFHWNTEKCMSTAIDSRLEFKEKRPKRYTLLLGKGFPQVKAFTIVYWIRLSKNHSSTDNGTILSYKQGTTLDIIQMGVDHRLWFRLFDRVKYTRIILPAGEWAHVAWTWNGKDGSWKLYWNTKEVNSGRRSAFRKPVPGGGEFVLGQASREAFDFDSSVAFMGDLAHLHVWDFVMSHDDIVWLNTSCTFMYCGNVAQWADFRSGTRGAMRMRWPSGILKEKCKTAEEEAVTCNKHCSLTIGAQCNKVIVENIVWERTKAVNYLNVSCPGQEHMEATNDTVENATRLCDQTKQNDGIWGKPFIDKCISKDLMEIKDKVKRAFKGADLNESIVFYLAELLLNHTINNVYTNPIDVATVIDLLALVVDTQDEVAILQEKKWREGRNLYAQTVNVVRTKEETKNFTEVIIRTVDNLLSRRNDVGWNATKPAGVEGDNLLSALEAFARTVAKTIQYNIHIGTVDVNDASIFEARGNIEFKVDVQESSLFRGYTYPSSLDKKMMETPNNIGEIRLPDILKTQNASSIPGFILTASFRFKHLAMYLPNHDLLTKSKEDNVNTPIIALYVFAGEAPFVHNLSSPIVFKLPFLDTFNISNPECVRIRHNSISAEWRWLRNDCHLIWQDGISALCGCSIPGVYAITTDMYNDHWDKGEKRPILMNAASYIGCALSALLCLATLAIHLYCKTSSAIASLHKNLALSIFFSQIVFMIGIDRYENQVVCEVFAVLIHYFVLSTYSWLMNETFNLYTTVTYSAHAQHQDLSDSGSFLRYTFLGWILPGVFVGAFVGSQGETYYAKDMCWIAWDNLWLFVGPTLGIVTVAIMVLILTAKEHNENSYTKSEKTNKVLTIQMKGMWTQIILVTVNWSFAFLSLKMHDSIIKYLYALMNVLQAMFFTVFNLLHEEIRNVLKANEKLKTLSTPGIDPEVDERSIDSLASTPLVEKDIKEALPLEKKRMGRDRTRERKSQIEASSEEEIEREGSDCEMITSL